MRLKNRGFTLIEATLALAVAGVVMGIAVPSLTSASEAAHSGAAKSAMVEAFARAMSHSTITGAEVVLCPANADACVDSTDWSGGWIAFADLDGNRSRGPNETLILHQAALTNGVHLRSTSGRRRLVFQPQGGAAAGSNVTFTLCDARGTAKATTLVLANSGQFRQSTPDPATAWACMHPP
jgi:type IV fimbrial biogenesis protein FimT